MFGAFLLVTQYSASAALKVELVVGSLARPVFVCSPPGESNRLFTIHQYSGQIRIYDRVAGQMKANAFLTIASLNRGNEEGLLGLAFHPGYRTNGYFYLNLNPGGTSPRRTEIVRFKALGDPATSDSADINSRKLILSYVQPESNHNGGWLGFGPDGYLYIASGDGGGGNDLHGAIGNAQNRASLLGKILRLDVNVPEDSPTPYAIPDGNPFKNHASYAEEIWAFGLRNPWRCSFDRETGNLWIGDVGQGAREEIDVIPSGLGGLNFGWRPREGSIQNPSFPNETPVTPAINPVTDYAQDPAASITGGYVYRGQGIPELRGKYIFADYIRARFWLTTLDASGTNGSTVEITSDLNPSPQLVTDVVSFGEDIEGELYICDLDGQIFKIVSEGPVPARISSAERIGSDLILQFVAAAEQGYIVEGIGALGTTEPWSEVATVPAAGTSRTVSITNAVTGDARFFRIRSE